MHLDVLQRDIAYLMHRISWEGKHLKESYPCHCQNPNQAKIQVEVMIKIYADLI